MKAFESRLGKISSHVDRSFHVNVVAPLATCRVDGEIMLPVQPSALRDGRGVGVRLRSDFT